MIELLNGMIGLVSMSDKDSLGVGSYHLGIYNTIVRLVFTKMAPLGFGHHVGLITRLGVLNFCQLAWILSVPTMATVSSPTGSGYGSV